MDTKVTNKALGGTTVSPFVVPPGMKFLIGMAPIYSAPGSTVSASGIIMELSGPALKGTSTPLQIPGGAYGSTLATTHSTPSRAGYIPTNIPVKDGDDINVTSNMVAVDTGDAVSQLELEFSDKPRPGWPTKWSYLALEALLATVDVFTQLEEAGAVKTFKMSGSDKFIRQIISATTSDSAGVGAQVAALRFTGKGIKDDGQWTMDGSGGTHATEGNGHAEARVRNVEIEINPNQPITPEAIFSGADTGNVVAIVGIGITES